MRLPRKRQAWWRRPSAGLTAAVAWQVAPSPASAVEPGPTESMYYLTSAGTRGQITVPLLWGLLILSIVVIVVISLLILVGIWRARRNETSPEGVWPPLKRGESGLGWIYGGLILSTVVLAAFVVWTMWTMVAIGKPSQEPRFTIEITGHQWWWQARYRIEGEPSRSFETANELHIPVGEPVRVTLASADVIHSFWVPALSGKTDLIPGQVNETWIQAVKPGVYRGQCAEFCGKQHAHMAMRLFADPPDAFEAWWNEQLEPAQAPQIAAVQAGQRQFLLRCAACHTVRGTPAGGNVGPDLTHLMSRTTIAAHTVPNTIGYLSAWIANPQVIKPESKMPNLDLGGPELAAIRNYLVTLE